jgi:hypothetical protein
MDPPSSADEAASAAVARRRAFRAFVRSHHPDVGGDPAFFAATVAAYRDGERVRTAPGARPTAYRRGGLLEQLRRQWRQRAIRRQRLRVR